MKVKVDASGKIIELNTCECNVDLPEEVMGTHLKSWTYVDSVWTQDPNYVPPSQNTAKPGRFVLPD